MPKSSFSDLEDNFANNVLWDDMQLKSEFDLWYLNAGSSWGDREAFQRNRTSPSHNQYKKAA